MRIISKFKDYYDCGMSWGQDSSLVYLRNMQEIDHKILYLGPRSKKSPFVYGNNNPPLREYTIGFCGKIYGCLAMCHYISEHSYLRLDKEQFCYDIQDVDRFVETFYDEQQKEYYNSPLRKTRRFGTTFAVVGSRNLVSVRRSYCEEFFTYFKQIKENYLDVFIERKSPIFVIYPWESYNNKGKTVLNEQLSKFSFAKVFDPVIAYQELSMFMGGMASPEKNIPEVSDLDMIEAKGFDNWSFRKMPSN